MDEKVSSFALQINEIFLISSQHLRFHTFGGEKIKLGFLVPLEALRRDEKTKNKGKEEK